ncbi:MAG: Alpha-galactosidase [Ferruginibacter sp.]|nr:Alpha-galactosidase [Ferruginibacter sp.]
MSKLSGSILFFLLLSSPAVFAQQTSTVWLDDLPIQSFSEGIRPVSAKSNYSHDTLQVNGVKYTRGIGAQSVSVIAFRLDKHAKRFSAMVAMDDKGNKDIPVIFYVIGDKKVLFKSTEMNIGDTPVKVEVDLSGIAQLGLLITDKIGGISNKRTYSNWLNAQLEMAGNYSPEHILNTDEKYILTPAPKETPKINSAKVFGATPGNPFLYTIAATGKRPMQFSVDNLPQGLTIAAKTGIITGAVKNKGTYVVTLRARNSFGETKQKLIIKIGDTIALTPPIGWNGWNAWETTIDREKVLASANAMVQSGLSNHGWNYINIDDAWQGNREGKDTALQPNEKFPNMKGMADYIHGLGLKLGLYSTPYIASYGGYVGASSEYQAGGETHDIIKVNRPPFSHIGKYRFETNDANQMASWGVDFLKYDWRVDVNSTERMSTALKQSGRDIIFSLSNNAPFDKANDWMHLSNMYRTGPDIKDSWTSLYATAFSLDKWAPFTGPGHWSDPDMMILGEVAIGPTLHPTRLTPDEQYSHVSIFSLLAAPLLIGCPIERLDKFTLNLLTNDEVIAINQDPLGKAGRLLLHEDGVEVWVKQLEDGSYGVGLFNTAAFGEKPQSYFRWGDEGTRSYELDFAKIGLEGRWNIRDVWRQKDLGQFSGSFKTNIPHHGVVMIRMLPEKN